MGILLKFQNGVRVTCSLAESVWPHKTKPYGGVTNGVTCRTTRFKEDAIVLVFYQL